MILTACTRGREGKTGGGEIVDSNRNTQEFSEIRIEGGKIKRKKKPTALVKCVLSSGRDGFLKIEEGYEIVLIGEREREREREKGMF